MNATPLFCRYYFVGGSSCQLWLGPLERTHLKATSGALNVEPTSKASVSVDKNGLSISATSTFYGAGKFEKPWLSLATGGMATLHVAAAKSGVFLSTKEEFMRQLIGHVTA